MRTERAPSDDNDEGAAFFRSLTDLELLRVHDTLLAMVPAGTRPEDFHGRIDLVALLAAIREVSPRNKGQANEVAELDASTFEVMLAHPTLSSTEAARVVERAKGLTAALTQAGPATRPHTPQNAPRRRVRRHR